VVVVGGETTDLRAAVVVFPASAVEAGFGGSVGLRVTLVVEVVVVEDVLAAAAGVLLGTTDAFAETDLTPGEPLFVAVDELLVDFLRAIDDTDLTAPVEVVEAVGFVVNGAGLTAPAPNVPELMICAHEHV
jgi:hypothetical protein